MMNPRELLNQQIKGHFTPSELINRSNESLTFKALDSRSKQMVVLKYYPPQESRALQEEVIAALRFQASQRGPWMVPVIDFGPHSSGGNWIITEQQSGRVNLLRYVRLQPQGRLDLKQTIAVLSALCDSLESLHALGLYHGNLKPTNVFLKSNGEVSSLRISDAMGSALSGVHKTDAGRVTFNDPTFFSYEQASGKGASVQSDLCALGLMGYFMLTGRFPFEGRTTDKLLTAVIIGSGRLNFDLDELRLSDQPEAPQLMEILTACTSKSSNKRPANASKLKARLTWLGAPSSSPEPESRSAPQTMGPGDPSASIFTTGGPQTMVYQSIDDESIAMLEAARAEFQAQYGAEAEPSQGVATGVDAGLPAQQTLMSHGGVPLSAGHQQDTQAAALLPPSSTPAQHFNTMMGLELSPEQSAQLEEGDTSPPEPQYPEEHGAEEVLSFDFDVDALSRSMKEALLDVSGEPSTSVEPSTSINSSVAFEPQTLISAGNAGPETLIEIGSYPAIKELLDEHLDQPLKEEDEQPYFEMHTTSSPSLELPFAPPTSLELPDEHIDHHVELFSEPARMLPPAPNTDEHVAFTEDSAYDPPTSPSEQPTHSQGHQTLSFDTYLEGLSAENIFPQVPAWQELMSLREQPEALTEALTRIKVPLTGLLLPFSQFQLQLEGHRFEEPFFDEPVEPLSLERLLSPVIASPVAALISAETSLIGASQAPGAFESEAPSVISAVAEGAQSSTHKRAQGVPTSLILLALVTVLGVGAYLAGALDLLSALMDAPEYTPPAPPSAAQAPPAPEPMVPVRERLEEVEPLAPPAALETEARKSAPEPDFVFDEVPTEPVAPAAVRSTSHDPKNTGERLKSLKRADRRAEPSPKPKPASKRATKPKRAPQKSRKKKNTVPGLKSVF